MRIIEQFFSVLAPSECLRCSSEGSLLCAWCREEALPEYVPRCYRCNKLSADSAVCTACRRKTPLRHVYIRTDYSGAARELVHNMKFKYSGEAADIVADELVNTLLALPNGTIIVHVPTATNHTRERGYDHARRIGRRLAQQIGFSHASLLARTNQVRQVGASRRTRLTQIDNAFRVRGAVPANTHIVLVDDVLTTGATLEAAARTLKEAGATSVDAIVFATGK